MAPRGARQIYSGTVVAALNVVSWPEVVPLTHAAAARACVLNLAQENEALVARGHATAAAWSAVLAGTLVLARRETTTHVDWVVRGVAPRPIRSLVELRAFLTGETLEPPKKKRAVELLALAEVAAPAPALPPGAITLLDAAEQTRRAPARAAAAAEEEEPEYKFVNTRVETAKYNDPTEPVWFCVESTLDEFLQSFLTRHPEIEVHRPRVAVGKTMFSVAKARATRLGDLRVFGAEAAHAVAIRSTVRVLFMYQGMCVPLLVGYEDVLGPLTKAVLRERYGVKHKRGRLSVGDTVFHESLTVRGAGFVENQEVTITCV